MTGIQDLSKQKKHAGGINPWRALSKKGGYLLSRIALFDTVYHQCMDGMVATIFKTSQNEKDLRDFSPRSLIEKKAATYSPALPYLTRCTISAWTVRWRRFSRPLKTKKTSEISLQGLR